MEKLDRIFEKLSLSIINEEIAKSKVYYTLLTKDNVIVYINFSNKSINQNSSSTIEKQIVTKIKKTKEKMV